MTILLWAALGTVVGAASNYLLRRGGGWTSFFLGVAIVGAARFLVGPFEAAAATIGVVAGSCLTSAASSSQSERRGLSAACSSVVLLPLETILAVGVFRVLSAIRLGDKLGIVLVGAAAGFATFRGQPFPYLVAAWCSFLVVLAFRLRGSAREKSLAPAPAHG